MGVLLSHFLYTLTSIIGFLLCSYDGSLVRQALLISFVLLNRVFQMTSINGMAAFKNRFNHGDSAPSTGLIFAMC